MIKAIEQIINDVENNLVDIGVKNNVSDTATEIGGNELFIEDTYIDSKGEMRKQYLITESGAMLLIMGFTGTRALMVKTQFIKEFTRMKNIINNPAQIIVNTGNAEAITAYGIQMTKIGRMMTDTANKLSKAEQERDIAQKEVQDKTALVNTTLANKNDYYWRKWCEDICHVTTNLANFILKKNKVYNGNSLISKQYADCFKMFLDHSGYPTKVITPKGQQVIISLFQPYMRLELLNKGKYTYNKKVLTNLGLI